MTFPDMEGESGVKEMDIDGGRIQYVKIGKAICIQDNFYRPKKKNPFGDWEVAGQTYRMYGRPATTAENTNINTREIHNRMARFLNELHRRQG